MMLQPFQCFVLSGPPGVVFDAISEMQWVRTLPLQGKFSFYRKIFKCTVLRLLAKSFGREDSSKALVIS